LGEVTLTEGDRRLWVDHALYDRATGLVTGEGHLRFAEPGFDLLGSHGTYNFRTRSGVFFNTRFEIPKRHGRGTAARIQAVGSRLARIRALRYTTCPVGQTDWVLHASHASLYPESDVGVAHDVWIDFYGVPFFWTPYLTFPLSSRRKSGFLAPSIGDNSLNGLDLSIPYYWNIAPNMDLTLTPRLLSYRGVLTGLEFRYLTESSRGELEGHYLPHDRVTDSRRAQLNYIDQTTLSAHTSLNANINYVSDPSYFQDFGTSLIEVAQPYQYRTLSLTYAEPDWNLTSLVQDIQTVDPTIPEADRPYASLPDILFDGRWLTSPTGLDFHMRGEFVRYQAAGKLTGNRLDLEPRLSYEIGDSTASLTPRIGLSETHYLLSAPLAPGDPTTLNRFAPIASLNGELHFERSIDGGRMLQTLVPRLFYLYIPYRNQNDIPVFDTTLPPFSVQQLFTTNRFLGIDRLGDANQLTAAVSTSFLESATGTELASFTAGEIFYFSNEQVTLPGEAPITQARSNYVAAGSIDVASRWRAEAGAEWDPYLKQWDEGTLELEYRPSANRVVDLAYRYDQDFLNQAEIAFVWPVAGGFSAVGSWDYSVLDRATLETFAGIQYDTCCWIFRLIARRFVTPGATFGTLGQADSGIYFQLSFKGLGSLGRPLDTFLQNDVLGYQSNATY
jgi:LPS-assembly protein